jgi:hypothetical protein
MSAAPQSPPKIVPKQLAPPPPALGGIIAYSGTGTGQTEESKMRATQAYVTGADRSAYAAPTPPAPPTAAAKPESNFSAESANDATTIDTATVESLPLAGRNTTNYAALTPGIVQPIKLPSKKPVASQLAAGNRILALDTAGALFLATDNGKHWRSIAPQWSGKAVQLSFAPSPARLYLAQPSQNQTQNSSNQTNGYINGAAAPPVPQQQTQQTIIPTVGFQLITNTGAVWLSTDGLTWHPR